MELGTSARKEVSSGRGPLDADQSLTIATTLTVRALQGMDTGREECSFFLSFIGLLHIIWDQAGAPEIPCDIRENLIQAGTWSSA